MTIAQQRTLRLALGTALSMAFCQAINWDMSFVAPVITLTFLGLPLPCLKPAAGIKFLILLTVSLLIGTALLPVLIYYEGAGLLLLSMSIFFAFYITAKGVPAVLGTFLTVGLALTAGVGTVSIDALLGLLKGVVIGAAVGLLFYWLAHGLMPDSRGVAPARPPAAKRPAPPPPPPPEIARRHAFRSLAVVFPILVWFLLSGSSASYAAVLIKVASMGQQVTTGDTAKAAKSRLWSTVIGGVGAVIGWQVLSIWPNLLIYVLVVALAGLVIGRRLFAGAALAPTGSTWSYGYLTMIVVLAPAVLDSNTGSAAGAAFWSRLMMFGGATLYSVVAVAVFDAFFRPGKAELASDDESPAPA